MATVQEIHEAANTLVTQGKKVTLSAVRTTLGEGSFITIFEALRSWPGRVHLTAIHEIAPDTLAESVATAAAEIWEAALQIAQEKIADEQRMYRQGIEAEWAEDVARADRMAEELASEQAYVRTLLTDWAHACDLLRIERVISAQLRAELAEANSKLTALTAGKAKTSRKR